jgi:hypothetical protein
MHLNTVNLRSAHLQFASAFLRNEVLKSIGKVERSEIKQWVNSASGSSEAAGLRGDLYEPLAHAELMRGGNFKFRYLVSKDKEPANEQDANLPKMSDGQFKEIPPTCTLFNRDFYYYPTWRTLETGDAFCICMFLGVLRFLIFQMTVSSHHDIKRAGLLHLLKYNTANLPVIFVFVVPDDIFSFWKEPVVVQAGKDEATDEKSVVQTPGMKETKRAPEMEQGVLVVTLSGGDEKR